MIATCSYVEVDEGRLEEDRVVLISYNSYFKHNSK